MSKKDGFTRTKKDEDDYNAGLRREEPIKTEIIVALQAQNKTLLENQARILSSLVAAEDALRVYRVQMLEQTQRWINTEWKELFAGKFVWDDVDGWHRAGE